ncbi:MAG: M56 family metallopeptidase [Oscillospiraceae bacterium]|nr:M56 family metallopeptidase [Oscillospiraceae bacterium]
MKEIMNFLPELLRINLVASFVILIVLAARLILKRAPKVFSYALWAIVLIRLLIPVSIPSPVSVIPDTPAASGAVINSALPEIEFETLWDQKQNYYESQNTSSENVQVYVSRTMEPMVYLSLAWLVGIAGMFLYSGISYLKIRKKVQIAVPLRDNIWIADDIKSPFVIGFLKPKIYLPNNLGEQEQEYIILHEQHHIRRLDHVIKTLAFLALTIHWFNPLVWIAFVLACKDMEMSCDEAVICKLGAEVRADYSASLLTLATGHRIIAGTPLAFGEGDTKGRIKNLAKWKKPAIWVLVLTIIICLILGVCLLTDRVSRQNQHVGTTFYYGNVTEQSEDRIVVLCNDGTQRIFYYEVGNEDIPIDLTGKQVKIRARLQDITGNLFTTQVSQVPDIRFDTLDEAIQNAILAHHSHRQDQEILDCASFFTYSSEGRSPAGSSKVDLVTEYGIVYHQGYRLEGGKLVEDGGCNVPTVLTFRVDDDGQYILAEYWEPRDGSYYPEDIKAKYPAFVWPNTQKNLFEQKIAVFNQAMEGFNVGSEVIIDHLITDICDRERWASGFVDLMTMCELQREILGYYSTNTLEYCFNQFENGNQNDLRGQVMAYVCSDILESMGQKQIEGWSWQRSGQDWYDNYLEHNEAVPDGYYVQEMGRTYKYKYELTGKIPGSNEDTTIVFYADTTDITFEDVVSVLDGFDSGEKALDIYIEDRGAFASDNS